MNPSTTLSLRPERSVIDSGLDLVRFLSACLKTPRGVAAIAPSGRALASLITREVDAATGLVLELGAGTGVFGQALIRRGVAESDLTLLETDPGFVRLLRDRFPRATVLGMDAAALAAFVPADPERFGATICGLGLLNMSEATVEAIVRGAFARMRPGAGFYLFTYGRRCSVSPAILSRLGLRATRIGTTWRNVPPASVYRLDREG